MTRPFQFTWKSVGVFAVLILLCKGWFFGNFIDEQENIVAGWLISQNWVLYRDFFLHHTPLPYYFSSLFFLGGQPAWWLWRISTLGYLLGIGGLIWRHTHSKLQLPLLLTGGLLAIAAPKLNLQMFLADSIFALSFLASVLLVFSYQKFQKPAFRFTLKWVLFFFFVSGWSTIAAVPPFLLLLAVLFFTEFKRRKTWHTLWLESKKPIAWFLFSAGIFPLYFFLSGAWHDFWWSTLTYNHQYYFPVRLAETAAEQQGGAFYYATVRLTELLMAQGALLIQTAVTFLLTFKGLITTLGAVSFSQFTQLVGVWLMTPITTLASDVYTVLALGWWCLIATFVWKRKWPSLFVSLVGSSLLFIRNNEIFHLSVFFVILFWTISLMWIESLRRKQWSQIALLGFFLVIAVTHFSQSYLEHLRHQLPLISYEQKQTAQRIAGQLKTGETLQVIGGDLTRYILSDRLPASKTIIYYFWFEPAGEIRQNLIQALKTGRPKLVLLEEQPAVQDGTYFDPELVKILQTYYSEGEQGIYTPKK